MGMLYREYFILYYVIFSAAFGAFYDIGRSYFDHLLETADKPVDELTITQIRVKLYGKRFSDSLPVVLYIFYGLILYWREDAGDFDTILIFFGLCGVHFSAAFRAARTYKFFNRCAIYALCILQQVTVITFFCIWCGPFPS